MGNIYFFNEPHILNQSYGISGSSSCDITKYESKIGATNPSCFVNKQVNAQPY